MRDTACDHPNRSAQALRACHHIGYPDCGGKQPCWLPHQKAMASPQKGHRTCSGATPVLPWSDRRGRSVLAGLGRRRQTGRYGIVGIDAGVQQPGAQHSDGYECGEADERATKRPSQRCCVRLSNCFDCGIGSCWRSQCDPPSRRILANDQSATPPRRKHLQRHQSGRVKARPRELVPCGMPVAFKRQHGNGSQARRTYCTRCLKARMAVIGTSRPMAITVLVSMGKLA